MLDFFRQHSKLMTILLFVLVVPSFVFFGVADYQSFTSNEMRLVNVNEQKITQSDFNQSWTQRLNELRNSQGATFDLVTADTPATRQAWLDYLTNNLVIQEVATQDRFSATDAMVRFALQQTPQFLENGNFSMEAYNRFLTGIGATSQQYENSVRGYEALNLVVNPVAESVIVPSSTVKLLNDVMTQEREVRLQLFLNQEYAKDLSVADEELTQWYEQNKASFEVPEYVNLEYVVLNQEAAVNQVAAPADADLEAYYQSNSRRFGTVERRHVKHIQVADLETATKVAQQAKQDPTQFDGLAKEYSLDVGTKNTGGDLGMLARGEFAELDEGVFALANPGVTDPVKIGNQYHVFQVVAIEPAKVKPFAEVKEDISKEVRLQLASERFANMATELTRLVHEQRDSLQAVAQELGLTIQTINGIARSNLLSKEQVGEQAALGSDVQALFETARVRETAFSSEVFNQGMNSGVIEVSPSEFLVIRVKDKVSAHIPKLDDIKTLVLERVKNEKAHTLAVAAGQEVLAKVKDDASVASFGESAAVSLMAGNLPEKLLLAVMFAPSDALPQYVGTAVDEGYALVRIDAVSKEKPELKQLFDQFQAPVLGAALGNEAARAFTFNLRNKAKVEVLPAAKQVIEGESTR